MLKIGDFSKLAQVSVKTLRYYGRLGLLKPGWVDRFTGYRYYALEQLPRLNRILALKDLGLSLDQIGQLLEDDLPAAELRGMLRLKRAELEHELCASQARLARVEARLRQIEHEGALPEHEVVLKQVEPQLVLGIRDVVPSYQGVGELFEELQRFLRGHRVSPEEAAPCLAVYYDTEYREHNVEVEVAVPIPFPVPSTSRMTAHVLPGAPSMASVIHQGGYETLSEAYNALTAWIQANRYRTVGPNRELYLQGVDPGQAPSCCLTELQLPVESTVAQLSAREKERMMEPKIVTMPALTVVGMLYHGKNEHDEIPAVWTRFVPRMGEVQHVTGGCSYGVCFEADESGAFDYVAGFEVERVDQLPEGMVQRDVPEAKYAVFPCTLKTIHETYDHAFHTWLPGSEYERAHGPDFELYGETWDPDDPESVMYIYIPVK